ncbi:MULTISPECIES: IclR family transcriptional regulator [unclassified Cryobacterium]|uniref:IclR family transcriptional regulator n=1 Tax=unclassified Cryobacterium TaxID=2649013 RepID=UPI00144611E7|nr:MULTISPECIES: IclR family transcriptional regulator [unclassified Cryobacterium]
MAQPGSSGHHPLLVLGKIADILSTFSLAQPEQTLATIRAATGLPPSTVQRLVGNLVAHGFLDRTARGYRIGARMRQWAATAIRSDDVVEAVKPVLTRLRDESGETACFFQTSGVHRVCVAMAETHQVLRAAMNVGAVLPLHAGSPGRVLLAWEDGLLEEALARDLDAVTERTIVDPDALRDAVESTRANGFAITTGERESGASGLSAPVFNAQGDLAGAVSIMGPTLRMPRERCEALVDTLLKAADELTAAIGGRRPAQD